MSKFCGYHQLNLSREYGEVMNDGQKTVTSNLVMLSKEQSSQYSTDRFGLIVSRKVGGACVRNRVKRRLRAILRDMNREGQLHKSSADASVRDFVIIARPHAKSCSFQDLHRCVRQSRRRHHPDATDRRRDSAEGREAD